MYQNRLHYDEHITIKEARGESAREATLYIKGWDIDVAMLKSQAAQAISLGSQPCSSCAHTVTTHQAWYATTFGLHSIAASVVEYADNVKGK